MRYPKSGEGRRGGLILVYEWSDAQDAYVQKGEVRNPNTFFFGGHPPSIPVSPPSPHIWVSPPFKYFECPHFFVLQILLDPFFLVLAYFFGSDLVNV